LEGPVFFMCLFALVWHQAKVGVSELEERAVGPEALTSVGYSSLSICHANNDERIACAQGHRLVHLHALKL